MNIASPQKSLDFASAIAEADIRCLLMVLVHMTGDEKWLEPPYLPKRLKNRSMLRSGAMRSGTASTGGMMPSQ